MLSYTTLLPISFTINLLALFYVVIPRMLAYLNWVKELRRKEKKFKDTDLKEVNRKVTKSLVNITMGILLTSGAITMFVNSKTMLYPADKFTDFDLCRFSIAVGFCLFNAVYFLACRDFDKENLCKLFTNTYFTAALITVVVTRENPLLGGLLLLMHGGTVFEELKYLIEISSGDRFLRLHKGVLLINMVTQTLFSTLVPLGVYVTPCLFAKKNILFHLSPASLTCLVASLLFFTIFVGWRLKGKISEFLLAYARIIQLQQTRYQCRMQEIHSGGGCRNFQLVVNETPRLMMTTQFVKEKAGSVVHWTEIDLSE